MDPNSEAMAEIVCYTSNTPPTTVVWMKSGEVIDADETAYDSLQVVVDRVDSHYRNILVVKEITSNIGDLTFTCNVSNLYGSVLFTVSTNLSGINSSFPMCLENLLLPNLSYNTWSIFVSIILSLLSISVIPAVQINPKLETETEGNPVVLECVGAVYPPKATAQLVNHLSIEWLGPDDLPITGDNFIVGEDAISSTGRGRTLTIVEAKLESSGLYSCQVTLDLQGRENETVAAQYHLVLFSELQQALYI